VRELQKKADQDLSKKVSGAATEVKPAEDK
jgi:hypothetical protein